jgi:hypothetical protein
MQNVSERRFSPFSGWRPSDAWVWSPVEFVTTEDDNPSFWFSQENVG